MGQHLFDLDARPRAADAGRATGIAASVRIATRAGFVAAGELRCGDTILTRDGGYRPIRGIVPLGLLPCGTAARGAALWLRPDHGILRRDPAGEEVLMPLRRLLAPGHASFARHLVVSIALDRHEVILAEGVWIESAPDPSGLSARPCAERPGAEALRNFRVAGGGGRA